MTSKEKTTTQTLPAGYNVFRRPFFSKNGSQATVSRKVIPYDKLNKAESMAIKRLFEALVPHDKTVPIDERLIWEEGLPAFEQFLGGQRFKKLKRYFGIGYNPLCKNLADEKEVRTMLGELRTIENARFYLHGFKDLIDRFADRLEGAPEGMDNITKAKVLRMFLVVFCSYYYFIEEFDFKPVMVEVEKEIDGKMQKVSESQIQTFINRQRAIANNSVPFYPEVLFGLEKLKFDKCGATTILYAPIVEEIKRLRENNRKNTCKELLRFAELKYSDSTFESVNATPAGQTYSTVRKLKIEVHYEPGVIPFEAYSFKDLIPELLFTDFYTMYKVLKKYSVTELDQKEEMLDYIEGSRFAKKPYVCYKIVGDNDVAGQNEADRIVWFMDFCAANRMQLKGQKDNEMYNVAYYLPAIKFATDMGYIVYEDSVLHDIEVAEMLMSMTDPEMFVQFNAGNITKEGLREIMGITEAFEKEHFPHLAKFAVPEVPEEPQEIFEEAAAAADEMIASEPEATEVIMEVIPEKPEAEVAEENAATDPYDVVIKFALANGYLASEDVANRQLIENVVIWGNEEKIMKFAAGEIDEETFKKRIGFEDEFADMYFDLKEVDVSVIEAKLLDLKKSLAKSGVMQRSALTVRLYCYLVENEVKCGAKNKAAKRNKSLKPANLKSLIEAA